MPDTTSLTPSPSTAQAVAKALNLQETGIFRLLVIITALLAWVLAMGGAGASLMQNLHDQWQLEKSQTLTVYLAPETDTAAIEAFTQSLPTLAGVGTATLVPPATLQAQLESHLQGMAVSATALPLPTVMNIPFKTPEAAAMLLEHVEASFPGAEVDTHQPLLQQVETTVRTLQGGALGLGGMMLALMGLLMTLTTRTGLLAESATLQLLVQLGGEDKTLVATLGRQVLARTLAGYMLGVGAAAAMLLVGMQVSPAIGAFSGAGTLAVLLGLPLTLPLMAVVTAVVTARHILRTQTL